MLDKVNAKLLLMVFFLVPLIFQTSRSDAGTVVVKPGLFDHFTLQIPERMVAGENFIIKVQAYDANKNLITNFAEAGKEFRIDISGTGVTQPSTLGSSSFSGGAANILVNIRKAEKITFAIREAGGTVPVISRELQISPNKLDHFVVQAPTVVTAGAKYDVRVIAKDLYDNTVSDIEAGGNLKVSSTGTASAKMVGSPAIDFRSGAATVNFISEKTGAVSVSIQELKTGSLGSSHSIVVNPGSLSYFKMQAPKTAVAGEGFDLLVAAYDQFDNVVVNYASVGSGAILSTTGGSKVEPSSLSPSDFKNGQAAVKAVYEKAETIQVIAKENNKDQSGKTGDIQVTNAAPDHFVVDTPDTAVSGQKFRIKIEAFDRFNNIVRNYNLIGSDVALSTSGTGLISPASVAAADFVNGVAMSEVIYDKAESFVVSARMAGEKVRGRVAVKEKVVPAEAAERMEPRAESKPLPEERKAVTAEEVRKETLQQPEVERKAEARRKAEAEKKAEAEAKRKAEKKAEAEAKRKAEAEKKAEAEAKRKAEAEKKAEAEARRKAEAEKKAEAEAKRKAEKKAEAEAKRKAEAGKKAEAEAKAEAKKEAEAKKKAEAEAEKKAEAKRKAETEKKMAEAKVEKKIEAKAEKKAEAPVEKKPEAKTEKKVEAKVEQKAPQVYGVSSIAVIEAKNKEMLVINVTSPNGHLEYSDRIISRQGKEWLKIKMKPALIKMERSSKFKTPFVGEVFLEEDEEGGNSVAVYIEVASSAATAYDITRVKNTLVVTFSKP